MRLGYIQKAIKNLDITCQESHLLYLLLRIIFHQKKKKSLFPVFRSVSPLALCYCKSDIMLKPVDQSNSGTNVRRGRLVGFIVFLILCESVKHFSSFNYKIGVLDCSTEAFVYLNFHMFLN